MRKRERKNESLCSYMDLEKTYDRVNMEALWQVLRMYDGVSASVLTLILV